MHALLWKYIDLWSMPLREILAIHSQLIVPLEYAKMYSGNGVL